MALHNMAKMSVTGTPGAGTITLNAAVTGFQSFSAAGVIDGETVSYSIVDGNLWEVGSGVYSSSGPTLTRNPTDSSAGGSAISATSSAVVSIAYLKRDFHRAMRHAMQGGL